MRFGIQVERVRRRGDDPPFRVLCGFRSADLVPLVGLQPCPHPVTRAQFLAANLNDWRTASKAVPTLQRARGNIQLGRELLIGPVTVEQGAVIVRRWIGNVHLCHPSVAQWRSVAQPIRDTGVGRLNQSPDVSEEIGRLIRPALRPCWKFPGQPHQPKRLVVLSCFMSRLGKKELDAAAQVYEPLSRLAG